MDTAIVFRIGFIVTWFMDIKVAHCCRVYNMINMYPPPNSSTGRSFFGCRAFPTPTFLLLIKIHEYSAHNPSAAYSRQLS